MNTAATNILTNPMTAPGQLAPITRIGGGEVRVDAALRSTTAAWDADARAGSLSFGYLAASRPEDLRRTAVVHNYSHAPITYSIASAFRFADDQASGAVAVDAPSSITVPAGSSCSFGVRLRVDASKLPVWNLNGGSLGGSGPLLNLPEYDGYITLTGNAARQHRAPRVAGADAPRRRRDCRRREAMKVGKGDNRHGDNGNAAIRLVNRSRALAGGVEAFDLTGTSPRLPRTALPNPGDNFAIVDLQAVGARLTDDGAGDNFVEFGIDTYGSRAHPNYPAEFDVLIDTNNNGKPDFLVFNSELGAFATTGQNVVNVVDLNAKVPTAVPVAFTDADLNSGNAIFSVPIEALGRRRPRSSPTRWPGAPSENTSRELRRTRLRT